MKIVRTIAEMRSSLPNGVRSLVPTMGALHEGHATLMQRAKELSNETVVSLFVNPTQFGPNDDLDKYPRTWEADVELCERESVNILFAPTAEEIYPKGFDTAISVGDIASRYEGAHRPGHFDGVATVVIKLFNLCIPDVAVFGKKDRQQCAVLAQVVRDLDHNVRLELAETRRESSGLAMSSRNRYFRPDQKSEAALLFKVLTDTALSLRLGVGIDDALSTGFKRLVEAGFEPDYLDLVDSRSYVATAELSDFSTLIAAARFHGVRLIDNLDV